MHLIKGSYVLVWYFSLHEQSFNFYFFYETWLFSMLFSMMTSNRYYAVTHFLTDPNEIRTVYVKLEIKDILFIRLFWFSEYLLRKVRFITKKNTTLHFSPILFGPLITVSSVRGTSFTYLMILFEHTHTQKQFLLKWVKTRVDLYRPSPFLAPPPH